jgi:predicted 2-oxoglutarate/Fe(II)-dependent dioxygenase YbiX
MISNDIREYVKVYSDFLNKDFCSEVIKSLEKDKWETHSFYDYKNNTIIQHNNELAVTYGDVKLGKELSNKIWYVIEQYILKDLKCDWYSSWSGYSPIRFNKYDKYTEMKKHCDHIHSVFDGKIKGIPTLSIVGLLNDNYEGGDFIMWDDKKIELSQGSIMIFPSNFMYPHKVTPITKGVRYSFVSWVY